MSTGDGPTAPLRGAAGSNGVVPPTGPGTRRRIGSSSPFGRYFVRRLLSSVPLIFGAVIVMFTLLELAPGDRIQAMVGDQPVSEEYRQQLVDRFNLDASAPERFVTYVANVARGDLGFSMANQRPVLDVIVERMGNTLLLTVTGLVLAAIGGVLMGTLAGRTRSKWVDTTVTFLSLAAFSVPVFWLGQVLIIVFSARLGWLPTQGMRSTREQYEGFAAGWDLARHLALPAIVIAARELGLNARVTRASMRETLGKDYILTARAKGLPESTIVRRHGLRNALLPVVTVVGYGFGFALSGSALVETVFGWPGMGRLLVESIGRRDNAVILGILLVVAVTVIVVNFITDIVCALLDPRVQTS